MLHAPHKRAGFTIVELLIVIVVIGVLAAIVIVAFRGISQRATEAGLQTDLKSGSTKLQLSKVESASGSYPVDLAAANLPASPGNSYQYSVDNGASPPTFCLTTTNGSTSYYISSTSSVPTKGGCPGHSVGGVAPITNLVPDPKLATGSASWATFNCSNASARVPVSDLANVSYAYEFGGDASGGTCRTYMPAVALIASQTYYYSAYVKAPVGTSFSLTLWNAGAGTILQSSSTTASTGSWQRLSVTWWNNGSSLNVRLGIRKLGGDPVMVQVTGAMIYLGGSGPLYNFSDGDTPGWSWSGTPNASSSTGIPLP